MMDNGWEKFGITPFTRGQLSCFRIENRYAVAEISQYGAQMLSFVPRGEKDLLFVSRQANFETGKAIRGGIPVCWPWFGSAGTPAHGVGRLSLWDLENCRMEADGSTSLMFSLDRRKDLSLTAQLRVNVGAALTVALTTSNCGNAPLALTEALHTYFAVSDIREITVAGLAGEDVPNAVLRDGKLFFAAETDLMCAPGDKILVIDDPIWQRKIRVERYGSRSAVIWNPWTDKAKRLADFGDEEYRAMLCVEAANVRENVVDLAAGNSHTLQTRLSLF